MCYQRLINKQNSKQFLPIINNTEVMMKKNMKTLFYKNQLINHYEENKNHLIKVISKYIKTKKQIMK